MEQQTLQHATNIALVENGVVTNVIWGLLYNMDEFPGAVQVDDLRSSYNCCRSLQ